MTQEFRAGFACLVGRPNAGKSTLTNALVGQKVAITSSKVSRTRSFRRCPSRVRGLCRTGVSTRIS